MICATFPIQYANDSWGECSTWSWKSCVLRCQSQNPVSRSLSLSPRHFASNSAVPAVIFAKKSRKICTVYIVKSRVRDSFVKMHSAEPEILSNSHALTLRKVRSKMASKRAAAIAAPDLAFVQPPNSFIVKFSALIRVFWNKNYSTVHKCLFSLFRVGFSLKK